jgi:hypothetical protein
MPDESETPHESKKRLYYIYPDDEILNEEDPFMSSQETAFATGESEDDDSEDYTIHRLEVPNKVKEEHIKGDPRDDMEKLEDGKKGDFRMFKFSIALTKPQVAVWKSILKESVSREGCWPGNILTEMKNRGFLTREQKENAIANRRNSANISRC